MSKVRIPARMPELPESLPPIFTLRPPRVDEKALLNLARNFRLKAGDEAGSIRRDTSTFTYSEGPFDLILHRASGAFRLKDRNRWQVDHRSHVELSDDEAVKRARALLKRYKLLPEESKVLRVSHLNVAVAGPDRKIQDKRVIDVAVCFQPVVRGVPVDGPGGSVTVYLDHEGEMTCIDHISRRLGPIHRKVTGLRSPEYALEEASRIWERRGIREVEINEIRFCYFELGWDDEQSYLQPAYIILATLIGSDERIRTGDIVVIPAAVNSVGRLVAPAPKRTAQRPRTETGRSNRPPGR
jgi:hypothetical protein